MSIAQTLSERWFERYLRETGHRGFETPEPDLGTIRRPDYLVAKNGARAVVEVKEFRTTDLEREKRAALDANHVFEASAERVLAPIRNKVRVAAAQLKPLAGRGMPLVVVLANPYRVAVDLRPPELGWALYGDPTVEGLIDPQTGEMFDARWRRGGNGQLSAQHAYLSAVVVLSAQAAETTPSVCVFETLTARHGASAPVPRQMFDGPYDERWVADEMGVFHRSGEGVGARR